MHGLYIQLSEPAYTAIAEAAKASGRSAEAIAADQLEADFTDEAPASFWTPEVLASIDAAFAEGDRLGGVSLDEATALIGAQSQAWRANHPA